MDMAMGHLTMTSAHASHPRPSPEEVGLEDQSKAGGLGQVMLALGHQGIADGQHLGDPAGSQSGSCGEREVAVRVGHMPKQQQLLHAPVVVRELPHVVLDGFPNPLLHFQATLHRLRGDVHALQPLRVRANGERETRDVRARGARIAPHSSREHRASPSNQCADSDAGKKAVNCGKQSPSLSWRE